jgi:hypothetical protein
MNPLLRTPLWDLNKIWPGWTLENQAGPWGVRERRRRVTIFAGLRRPERETWWLARDDANPEVYGFGRTPDEARAFYRLSARIHGLPLGRDGYVTSDIQWEYRVRYQGGTVRWGRPDHVGKVDPA